MSSTVFWDLTKTDFNNCLTNDFYAGATFLAGAAVAGLVTSVALEALSEKDSDLKTLSTKITSMGIGTLAGVTASAYVAYRSSPISFVDEKAFKFLALTVFSAPTMVGIPIFAGGAWSAFGRVPLYYLGLFGALTGATYFGERK
jgi:hypothetical protein